MRPYLSGGAVAPVVSGDVVLDVVAAVLVDVDYHGREPDVLGLVGSLLLRLRQHRSLHVEREAAPPPPLIRDVGSPFPRADWIKWSCQGHHECHGDQRLINAH